MSKADSMIDRIRAVWAVVEVVVEEAIVAAEALSKPGTEKKAYVIDTVSDWLRKAEGRFDILPSPIEGLVFSGIEWALSMIVERVFRRLQASGTVG